MYRTTVFALAACAALGVLAGAALSAVPTNNAAIDVAVQVSPSTIVLGLKKGSAITVHTDIAFGSVDRATVALSGVPATATFSDSCGNLVAKFNQADIEAIVAPPQATLVLTGLTVDGVPFSGADLVRVIADPSPADAGPFSF